MQTLSVAIPTPRALGARAIFARMTGCMRRSWLGALLLGACGGPAMPAPRNSSPACQPGEPPPTAITSPGWPCWPTGMAPDDAAFDITNEGDVAARPETVWAWLTRADVWTTYFPRAKNVHVERGGPTLTVGSVVVWEMLGSTIHVTVERAEAPNVLAWEGGASGVHAYHAWLIAPRGAHGERSHVVTVETERGFLPSVAGWSFKGSLRSAHDEWIAGLAKVAAGDRLPPPVPSAEGHAAPPQSPPPRAAPSAETQPPRSAEVEPGVPYEGETTTLRRSGTPPSMRLDGPEGSTTLLLRSKAQSAEIASFRWDGDWRVEVYARSRHAYVLSLHGIFGASRAVQAIRYLDESGGLRDAALAPGWYAYTLVPSSDGRALAFVGTRDPAKGMGLELLDVARDRLVELGRAPGPPPHDFDCEHQPYGWGAGVGDGYEPMDPGIIEFVDGRLRVSYADDTCHARAGRRTIREWPIEDLGSGHLH
jgi:uncharacterized protein YndB with AHSA1/START domain